MALNLRCPKYLFIVFIRYQYGELHSSTLVMLSIRQNRRIEALRQVHKNNCLYQYVVIGQHCFFVTLCVVVATLLIKVLCNFHKVYLYCTYIIIAHAVVLDTKHTRQLDT